MPKENLTDRRLRALKPAAPGTDRYEIQDGIVPGLLIRVTEAGKKSFALLARFPGKSNPTRRLIGEYGAISLEDARVTARAWIEMVGKGIDPKVQLAETKSKEVERQGQTLGKAVKTYIETVAVGPDPDNPILRQGSEVARCLLLEFVNDRVDPRPGKKKREGLGKRPISGITKSDIMQIIDDAIARGSKTMAHNLLAYGRAFFNWAVDSEKYGIEASPCDRIKPKKAIGKKNKRKRILNDDELAAFWEATEIMGYPYGSAYRLLLLSCLRLNEVAEAPRTELRLDKKMWSIPKERMKMENDHHVPLSDLALELVASLPEFDEGPYLFTTTKGEKPLNGFSKAKARLDREMLAALKRRAVKEGRDPEAVTLPPFVNHDLRRTARTWLSGLKVPKVVAELILAHVQKDLDAVYDQWAFIEERQNALQRWADRVRSVVEPGPANVVSLDDRRSSL